MVRSSVRRAVVATAAIAMLLLAAGCSKPEEPKAEPKVAPPAVKTAGALTVGVDLDAPPFAGTDEGQQAGLDVDVARAIAEQLGLTVTLVDVKPSDAATALADGTVDAVMSVPLGSTILSSVSLVGAYAYDGPAFFVSNGSTQSVEPSLTLETLDVPAIAAQKESESFWRLSAELDPETVKSYDVLREALEALAAGEVPVVAGDAFVGAYIARDIQGVHFAGQLTPAVPLSVAVAAENAELADAIRTALDTLDADGVLSTLRRKWVGELPELAVSESSDTSPTP